MSNKTGTQIFELSKFRDQVCVFRDRAFAGKVLADMLKEFRNRNAIVMAIPAGGVAVGAVIAKELNLPLDVAVVSKITLPWNSEAGYGAVAFDGTVKLNQEFLSHLNLNGKGNPTRD
jgi:predicted phosphoribosyltransferase